MSKLHNFAEDTDREHNRTLFCRRCGKVVWFYNRGADWNLTNLQKDIGECLEDGEDIIKPKKDNQ